MEIEDTRDDLNEEREKWNTTWGILYLRTPLLGYTLHIYEKPEIPLLVLYLYIHDGWTLLRLVVSFMKKLCREGESYERKGSGY